MPEYQGLLKKMKTTHASPVQYSLQLGEEQIPMNELLGKRIQFIHSGNIYCKDCGNKTKKSFAQGFCYPCMMKSPMASECIMHPEKCQAHLGIGRDMEWEEKYHLSPQYVYLSKTSGVKVGVTRNDQIPTRWIDQGASAAMIIAQTPNRYLAGCIEVALKQHISDKTNWRMMLKNESSEQDIQAVKTELINQLDNALKQYLIDKEEIMEFEYPVIEFPDKVKSLNFDKTPTIEGTLSGIKAQYLMLDQEFVLNIRKFEGYEVLMSS